MFAGRRRRSSNIRAMQLFHELKQQFPTVPDHVVSSCIASHAHSNSLAIRQVLEAAAALNQEPMGRSPPRTPTPSSSPSSEEAAIEPNMNDGESDNSVKFSKKFDSVSVCSPTVSVGKSAFYVKRPDRLDVGGRIQPSEKCKDVHKLLNSERPPRSPLGNKRHPSASPDVQKKLETVSTPTQTTDTLLGPVNLSLNVNCSMDLVQTPGKHKSIVQVTPQQPWLQEPVSPRSYTSVNLTLRPPSSEPQPPIDITSQNSSLTYSTSSFDSQKGLQSRLQITVGPGGGSVASVRSRPRSSYHPEGRLEEILPVRAGSLDNLTANEPPVIIKQQARIERLRIELRTEKAKLESIQSEVSELEENKHKAIEHKTDVEIEKQLRKEIKHLQYQCEQLAQETDKNIPVDTHEDFYQNIYTGQRGPLNADMTRVRRPNRGRFFQSPLAMAFSDFEGPKWNCHLCTFLNHPDLDKCEQCEMPRILHVSAAPGDNIHIHVTPRLSRRVVHSWVL